MVLPEMLLPRRHGVRLDESVRCRALPVELPADHTGLQSGEAQRAHRIEKLLFEVCRDGIGVGHRHGRLAQPDRERGAQLYLGQLLGHVQARVLPPPELLVAKVHEKFDAGLRLKDEGTRKLLADLLVRFSRWVGRERAAAQADRELLGA